MAFHEQWFSGPKQRRLAVALAALQATSGEVVEVGCWEGRSTITIANHFAPLPVHCVDHWQGDLTDPKSHLAGLAAQRDVFADFRANMDEHTAGNYTVHRQDWREFAEGFTEPIRFIFIDGQHTYEEVLDNIAWCLPLMVEGGVIAGDDFTMAPVRRAVTDMLGVVERCSGPGAAIWHRVV